MNLNMNCNDIYCVLYKNLLAYSHDEFNYYSKENKLVLVAYYWIYFISSYIL